MHGRDGVRASEWWVELGRWAVVGVSGPIDEDLCVDCEWLRNIVWALLSLDGLLEQGVAIFGYSVGCDLLGEERPLGEVC